MNHPLHHLNTLNDHLDDASRLKRWLDESPDTMRPFLEEIQRSITIDLYLTTNGLTQERIQIGPRFEGVFIRGLLEGEYCLTTSTGWLLWQAYLDETHLIWTKAYPQKPLPLAASFKSKLPKATRIWTLEPINLTLSIHPGQQTGTIQLKR